MVMAAAIRRGDLQRADQCEECRADKPQAHHPDYSRPLFIRWLCRSCHGARHRVENQVAALF
jgi:hypothetical protein